MAKAMANILCNRELGFTMGQKGVQRAKLLFSSASAARRLRTIIGIDL